MLLRSPSTPILGSLNSSHTDVAKESDITHTSLAVYQPPPSPCHSLVPLSHCSSSNSLLLSAPVDSPCKAIQEQKGDLASQPWLRRAQSEGDLATLSSGFACVYAASSLVSPCTDETESALENTSSCNKQWAKRKSFQSRSSALYRQDSITEERESLESGSEGDAQGSEESREESSALSARHRAFELADYRKNSHLDSSNLALKIISVPNTGRGFLLDDGEIYTSLSADANGFPVVCNSRGCRPLTKLESEKLGFPMSSGLGLGKGGGYNGGNGWNDDGRGSCPDSNGTDVYYQSLLQADPQNPLLLRNYAQYLNEVKGDCKRSEEYLERAILVCPGDGDVLAQYAKLQWDVHKDQDRAEKYYDQAVQAAPDDCYVMASYASFLWDSEDNEDVTPPPPLHPTIHNSASSAPASLLGQA